MKAPKLENLLAMAGFGAATAGVAFLGSRFMPDAWFRKLKKPWFQPPNWVFGPVWTGLYTLIAASGYRVWRSPASPERDRALAWWGAQLALNAAWTPLFFGGHSPRAALFDIGALRIAIDAYIKEAEQVDPAARWMMAPYKGWISFATLLNADIAQRNA